jgi:hypothetical protein
MFDNMSTSASHLVLKQDVTIFLWLDEQFDPFVGVIVFDDPRSYNPCQTDVRRLGVVEYQVELSRSAAVFFLSPSYLLRISIPSFLFACCLRFDLSAPP